MDFLIKDEVSSDVRMLNYKNYLRETGVLAKLNQILERLFNTADKPANPLHFIRRELGDKPLSEADIEKLEQDLDDAEEEIRRLSKLLRDRGVTDFEFKEPESDSEFTPERLARGIKQEL